MQTPGSFTISDILGAPENDAPYSIPDLAAKYGNFNLQEFFALPESFVPTHQDGYGRTVANPQALLPVVDEMAWLMTTEVPAAMEFAVKVMSHYTGYLNGVSYASEEVQAAVTAAYLKFTEAMCDHPYVETGVRERAGQEETAYKKFTIFFTTSLMPMLHSLYGIFPSGLELELASRFMRNSSKIDTETSSIIAEEKIFADYSQILRAVVFGGQSPVEIFRSGKLPIWISQYPNHQAVIRSMTSVAVNAIKLNDWDKGRRLFRPNYFPAFELLRDLSVINTLLGDSGAEAAEVTALLEAYESPKLIVPPQTSSAYTRYVVRSALGEGAFETVLNDPAELMALVRSEMLEKTKSSDHWYIYRMAGGDILELLRDVSAGSLDLGHPEQAAYYLQRLFVYSQRAGELSRWFDSSVEDIISRTISAYALRPRLEDEDYRSIYLLLALSKDLGSIRETLIAYPRLTLDLAAVALEEKRIQFDTMEVYWSAEFAPEMLDRMEFPQGFILPEAPTSQQAKDFMRARRNFFIDQLIDILQSPEFRKALAFHGTAGDEIARLFREAADDRYDEIIARLPHMKHYR